ncbi:MAG: hypothetical protein IT534_07090 [Bauldia sp.]|nr:hypothetical protein [Bauldia sp.]
MKVGSGLLALAIATTPAPVLAQQIWVEAGIDCGQWVSAPGATKDLYEAYLLGTIDAWAVAHDLDFWRVPTRASRDAVYVWIDNWCRSNPLSLLIDGASAMFQFRTGVKPD